MIINKKKDRIITLLSYAFLAIIVIIAVFPILWMFDSSLKGQSEIYSSPPTFFIEHITLIIILELYLKAKSPEHFLTV